MSRDDPTILEFLFAGPLFSVFKGLNQIIKGLNQVERKIMGLKEQIDGYTSRIDAVATEIRSELQALNDKLAAASAPQPVDPDVQASLDALGDHITSLEGVESPSVPSEPTTGGVVVDPGSPQTDPGTLPATDSPGEPSSEPVDPTAGSATDDSGDLSPGEPAPTTEVTPEENV